MNNPQTIDIQKKAEELRDERNRITTFLKMEMPKHLANDFARFLYLQDAALEEQRVGALEEAASHFDKSADEQDRLAQSKKDAGLAQIWYASADEDRRIAERIRALKPPANTEGEKG